METEQTSGTANAAVLGKCTASARFLAAARGVWNLRGLRVFSVLQRAGTARAPAAACDRSPVARRALH
ncbi:hypothetical protein LBMAG56_45200 [Verrucomicrobiota bacterium]|nr:hypothetical protein LBMAG56_45200 [Verrucomicrobiota bacterium]